MSERVPRIAQRMSRIDASGIRKVFDLAQHMENPVNLSIGQPHFDIPEVVKEAGIQAAREGFNSYTPTQGTPELRDAIRESLSARGIDVEDVLVTSGCSGALVLAIFSLVNPDDEVLIPDPYFVMYKHLVNIMGGKPVFVDTYPDFRLTADRIRPHLTPRSKLLVINSPCNPTGAVCSEGDLKEIAALAGKHGIFILADEVYRSFSYDGPSPSIATFTDDVLVCDGFSKSHAMTGWRIGFAAGPSHVVQEMAKLQQYSFVCAPSISQKAAVAALKNPQPAERAAEYRRKRDLIYEGLKDRFEVVKPTGAFYIFPKVPEGLSDIEFVERAIEQNVLIIPGSVFSEKGTHFRISFAAPDDVIRKGIEVLTSL